MPLTREQQELRQRAHGDQSFRREMLIEAIQCFLSGDMVLGKGVLRDYVNSTIGFAKLAEGMECSPKNLMRMLSPTGNPRANNLFAMIAYLQRKDGVRLKVTSPRR